MARITVVLFTDPDRPFKTLSFGRGMTVFLSLLALGIIVAAGALAGSTLYYRQQAQHTSNRYIEASERVATLNATASKRLESKDDRIADLEQTLEQTESRLDNVRAKLDNSKEELRSIREMELKVRRYLGLDTSSSALELGKNQTHQGGFGLPEDWADVSENPSSTAPPSSKQAVLDQSKHLKQGLREVVQALEDRHEELRHLPSIMPVSGEKTWISCSYGWRNNPFTEKKEFHDALDIAGAWKTPLIAPADGTVSKVGENHLVGRYLRIKHANGFTTSYGHLQSVAVEEGQSVQRRDVIGHMGNSGRSTGTHVHYKVEQDGEAANPMKYILDRSSQSLGLR
ncbi:MAG: peptidoglycan DD-metalloendopeptidase family protein [Thermodesulfobacteriota bacterium]